MSSSNTTGADVARARLRSRRQSVEAAPSGGGPVGARRRWRPGLIALGAAGTIACASGVAWMVGNAGEQEPVLSVVRPVSAGQVITARDVGVVRLGVGDATQVVPAGRREAVIGRRAVVPLLAGQLLAPGQVGDSAKFPAAGRALVVVGVEPGMLPAGLAAGQPVAVVPGIPPGGRATSDGDTETPDPVLGVVHAVRQPQTASGKGAVTMLVDAGAVRRVAQLTDPRIAVLSASVNEEP